MADAQVHTGSAGHSASFFSPRQRTIAVVIVALAFIMDLLDSTIVNVAIPSIQADLGATYSTIQWLSAGYALAFAVLLITGGRLGDVVGYKKLFIIGASGFTVASLLSGLAWNSEVLIAARLFQGAMAALMVPQGMSLIQVMYPPKERGAILGIFGAMAGLAASLGPIVGGLLIEWNIGGLDWRPIFLINIPVGVFAIIAGLRFLPNGKSPHPLKLDVVGTLLIIVALTLVVFPLIQGRELDWPVWVYVMMAASIPFFLIFWWWQLRKTRIDNSPLVIPSLFRIRTFTLGSIINIIFEMIMLGFFFTFTLLLQIGLGFDVLKAALTGIPTAIGITLSIAWLAQKLTPILGRYLMTLGTVIMAIGFGLLIWILASNGINTNPWQIAPGIFVIGLGMGMVMGLMFSVTLKDVDPKDAGSASGTLSAIQQLGGAIGIALIGVLFFGALTGNAATSFESTAKPKLESSLTAAGIPAASQASIIDGIRTCYNDRINAKDTSVTPESCTKLEAANSGASQQTEASKNLQASIVDATKSATSENFISAFRAVVIYALVLIIVSFLLSFTLPRKIVFDATH